MNKSLKKVLSLFLSLTILLGCFGISWAVYGIDNIELNETNFADPVFRKLIGDKYDTEYPYGFLSAEEIAKVPSYLTITGLTIDGKQIKTLKGIEFFADRIERLRCTDVQLEELDVSALYRLTDLTVMSNNLTSLDVSNNSELKTLNCAGNMLETLNLGSINTITTLYCQTNRLKSVDVSNLTALANFKCDQNELTSLDVTANSKLVSFSCSKNHLSSLDLSQNTLLGSIADAHIGRQTIDAQAVVDGSIIAVPVAVNNNDFVTGSSLDTDETANYSDGRFTADDVADINSGIDYTYSTQNINSVDMNVHINVVRDFYQIRFYTGASMSIFAGKCFVAANSAATAPEIMAPQCKTLDRWSSDISAVTEDMDVYPIWKDNHTYALKNFENGIALISCVNNDDSYTVIFEDCINAAAGDDNYCEYIDVVADGYINAKDYAKLIKMF